MGITFYYSWEIALIEWIQSRMGTFGTSLAGFCSFFGETTIIIVVIGILYWGFNKDYAKYVGLNVLVAAVLSPLIKNIFIRRRPYFDTPEIKCLKPAEKGADIYDIEAQGFSFPSMHSTIGVALYGSLGRYSGLIWVKVIAIIFPILIGISRFSLGVHYPTDVLAGWILGLFTMLLIPEIEKRIDNKLISYGIYALIGLPGWFYCTSDDYYAVYGILVGVLLAFLFEQKYVNFENTNNVVYCLTRLICGAVLFIAMSSILKVIFNADIINNNDLLYRFARFFRYSVSSFVVIGIYPILFKKFRRIYG
ncbi:phosphatase PAP2 family protein [Butyrivibrio sp. NC2002]|uniref:phosphatase PAP2 family protein n=1 Tax=Butyrivibrio sp. NC2002 TaxID=1410610 RepID=UPI000561178F|nr:phosphatase PAP2 family protein [Butyrivibrio sp. NC2002]